MSPTHAPRTALITTRAARDGTRVVPALVTRPEDSHYDAMTSLADPGGRAPEQRLSAMRFLPTTRRARDHLFVAARRRAAGQKTLCISWDDRKH
jgi:hypothetical protein